jgi:hypothetical protein
MRRLTQKETEAALRPKAKTRRVYVVMSYGKTMDEPGFVHHCYVDKKQAEQMVERGNQRSVQFYMLIETVLHDYGTED